MASLNPFPGYGISSSNANYIYPDIEIEYSSDSVSFRFQSGCEALTINKQLYNDFSARLRGDDKAMEQVANQEGINRIVLILKGWAVNDLPDNYNKDSVPLHQRFKQISERINYFAPSIDSTKAAKMANYVVTSVENISAENIPDDLKVRMYIHVVTMFERLKSEGPLAIPDDADQTIQKCPKFYHLLKGIMENACRSVDVKLQDSEIYYFMLSLPESIRLESEGNIHESHSNLD